MKKYFKAYYIRFIELFINVGIVLFLGELESLLSLPKPFTAAPLILFTLLLVLVIIEFVDERPIKRLILITILVMLTYSCLTDGIELANAASIIFSLVNVPFLIIKIFKSKSPNEVKTDMKKEKTTYTKKQVIIINVITYSLIAIIASLFIVNAKIWKINPWFIILGIILFIVLSFIIILLILLIVNPTRKLLKNMNRYANYKEFETGIDKLMMKNNSNLEYLSFLKILKVNCLYAVDLNQAINLFESIEKPGKLYIFQYEVVEIMYYLNTKQNDKALELINAFDLKYSKPKLTFKVRELIRIQNQGETCLELDKDFPINTKYKFLNLSNANFLMEYYNLGNNLDKALYYANYILSIPSDLNEIIKGAKEVLAKVENNE